jgi:hypothetical protein
MTSPSDRATFSAIILARDKAAERTRAQAKWDAMRRFYWDSHDATPVVMGRFGPSTAQQLKALREGGR